MPPAGEDRGGARPRPACPAARRAVQRHGPAPAPAHDGAAPLDGGRRADDPVSRRTSSRRSSDSPNNRPGGLRGRLAASGDFREIRRLDDRPAPTRSRSARTTIAASLHSWSRARSVFGVELVDGMLTVRAAEFAAFTLPSCPGWLRDAGITLFELRPDGRVPSRVSLPNLVRGEAGRSSWSRCAARLGRRRTILVALAGRPARPDRAHRAGRRDDLGHGEPDRGPARCPPGRDGAAAGRRLVFGTGVLGSELDDGTAVYLAGQADRNVGGSCSPKAVVAAGITLALVVPSTLVAGLVVGAGRGGESIAIAFAVAVIPGSLLYAVGFSWR